MRGENPTPPLSEDGKKQALLLAKSITENLNGITEVTIWTSTAKRASQTAQIIKQEMQLAAYEEHEKLWSDNHHKDDFFWLGEKLNAFNGDILIIISHLEYVRQFPNFWKGFNLNEAGYAEGVLIEDGRCCLFS